MAYTTIDDGSAHFQTAEYTGDGNSGRTVTNSGNSNLQPDWIWIKYLTAGVSHVTYDSSRGATKRLYIDFASTEATQSEGVQSFDSDGFTLGNASASNGNTIPFAAWQWHANGGTTSSNTDGSITSTVQANTDAGISILTYTGTGSAATIGHGLGKAPAWIIVKSRTTSANWTVRHHRTDNNYDFLSLNESNAATANDGAWTQTDPTTSVFSIGTASAVNQSGIGYIAYCFSEIQGFSKFGQYHGNGSSDGSFVYTGFKPAFLLVKSVGARNWILFDSTRDSFNLVDEYVYANQSSAEAQSSTSGYDFLSNGFKARNTYNDGNVNHEKYLFMAFAESPFVTSSGVPNTAR